MALPGSRKGKQNDSIGSKQKVKKKRRKHKKCAVFVHEVDEKMQLLKREN